MNHYSAPSYSCASASTQQVACRLTWVERILLMVGIVEIPLQIDKYLAFREQDAMLGALGGLNVSVTTLALIVLYGLWFADMSLHRRRTILRPLLGLPMLFYIAINIISVTTASVPILSLFDLALLVQAYGLFFFIANRIQTPEDVLLCVFAFAMAILTQTLAMLFAFALHLDGEAIAIGPLVLAVQEGQRHVGTMDSPNLAGSTLAMLWLVVATPLIFIENKRAWRIIFLCAGLGLPTILMTQSRGAIVTICFGCLIIAGGLLSRGWLPKWTIVAAVLLASTSIYPLSILYQNRIKYGDDESAASRIGLTAIALEAISERPLLGYGAGNCHLATQKFADQASYRAEWFYTVHCKYLIVWVETGILGLFTFLMVLGNGFRHGINVWCKRADALSALALAIVAAVAGQMVHMSVDLFNSRTLVQLLWCMLGLVAALYKLSNQECFQHAYAASRVPAISGLNGISTSSSRGVHGGTI